MIHFNNAGFFKLRAVDNGEFFGLIAPFLVQGEEVLSTYKGIRDGVVFTTKRIISINVQGITGTKKDFTSLPYSKIQAFSVETAGTIDLDSELDLWFSGMGKVRFEFVRDCNITAICHMISNIVL